MFVMLEDGDRIQGIFVPDGQGLKMPNRLPPCSSLEDLHGCGDCVKKHIGDGLGCGTLVG